MKSTRLETLTSTLEISPDPKTVTDKSIDDAVMEEQEDVEANMKKLNKVVQKIQKGIDTQTKLYKRAIQKRKEYRLRLIDRMVQLCPYPQSVEDSRALKQLLQKRMSSGIEWDDYHELDDLDVEHFMRQWAAKNF